MIRLLRILLLPALLVAASSALAQEEEQRHQLYNGADTLLYTYTPIESDSLMVADTVAQRNGLLRRIVRYFEQSAVDRTFEKKLDITFAGGPSYSKTTSLGLGLLAAGLYRTDRTDSLTPPSDVTLFSNISISGFYSVGITGNTIFRHSRRKLDYLLRFSSSPRDFWGFGYDAGRNNQQTSMLEQRYQVRARFLNSFLGRAYIGAMVDFDHTSASKVTEIAEGYLNGQRHSYTTTGVGAVIEYDTRDFIPNPSRGIYFSLQEIYYPKCFGNGPKDVWRTIVRGNAYHRLWRDALLAYDIYGEFNSKGTPWTMMARMGDNERMRGYYNGRYTDNNMVTAQIELRQHIWRRIGCVAWCGAGNVFPALDEFRVEECLPNYGLGLRWELKKRVNIRFDYGIGHDTGSFLLSINEAF